MNEYKKIKIKYVANVFTGNSIPDDEKVFYTGKQIPYIPTKEICVDNGFINYNNGLSVDLSDGFKIAPLNSVLMCVEGGSAGKKIGFTDRQVAFVNKLCCLHGTSINCKYLYYALHSKDFLNQFFLNITGLIGGVSLNVLKNLYISVPIINIQNKIVSFLDDKCSKIDELIALENQQIEKLKEYKQALITEIVKKGINNDETLLNSNIYSIGMYPSSWRICRIKDVATISNGKEILVDGGDIPVYGSGGVFKYTKEPLFSGVSLLLGRKGTIDNPILVEGDFWTVDTMFYTSEIKDIEPKYLYYCSKGLIDFEFYKSGSVLPSMTQTELKGIYITYPPKEIQIQLINYLDEKCSKIETLIINKQQKIDKLNEYKKSLIYEYVTGKKEVQL